MDFSIGEEQQALAELAGRIFGDRATPERLREWDGGVDGALWAELARAHLLGVALPEDVGGAGLGFFELCLVLEEQGRHLAPVPLVPALVQAGLPIAAFGDARQRARLLAPLARGEAILSGAFLEPGVGDATRTRVAARPDGTAWRLDGEKVCVPAADAAARVLVPAAGAAREAGVFLVDPSGPGVTLEAQVATHGERVFRMRLDGAPVAAGDVLGDPRAGGAIVRWIEERARVALAAVQLGVAEEALRRTAAYTGQRKQFGRPIGSFQAVSLRAADAYIDVEAMRSTLWQAAWRLSEGLPAAREAAVAGWWACRGGHRVVHAAQHLHGGQGADVDYPIHRYFLWARHVDVSLGGASRALAGLGPLLARAEAGGA